MLCIDSEPFEGPYMSHMFSPSILSATTKLVTTRPLGKKDLDSLQKPKTTTKHNKTPHIPPIWALPLAPERRPFSMV